MRFTIRLVASLLAAFLLLVMLVRLIPYDDRSPADRIAEAASASSAILQTMSRPPNTSALSARSIVWPQTLGAKR